MTGIVELCCLAIFFPIAMWISRFVCPSNFLNFRYRISLYFPKEYNSRPFHVSFSLLSHCALLWPRRLINPHPRPVVVIFSVIVGGPSMHIWLIKSIIVLWNRASVSCVRRRSWKSREIRALGCSKTEGASQNGIVDASTGPFHSFIYSGLTRSLFALV